MTEVLSKKKNSVSNKWKNRGKNYHPKSLGYNRNTPESTKEELLNYIHMDRVYDK